MSPAFYAYIHAKPDGTPFYVGKGRGLRASRLHRTHNAHHRNIVAKYGAENILVGKVECSSESIAFELEKGLIKCLRRSGVVLVNRTDGGDGMSGLRHSEEVKKNQSKRMREIMIPGTERYEVFMANRPEKAHLGHRHSEETRAKISAATKGKGKPNLKGKPKSPEHKAKVLAAIIARPPMSEETKRKLSATQKAVWEKRKRGEV